MKNKIFIFLVVLILTITGCQNNSKQTTEKIENNLEQTSSKSTEEDKKEKYKPLNHNTILENDDIKMQPLGCYYGNRIDIGHYFQESDSKQYVCVLTKMKNKTEKIINVKSYVHLKGTYKNANIAIGSSFIVDTDDMNLDPSKIDPYTENYVSLIYELPNEFVDNKDKLSIVIEFDKELYSYEGGLTSIVKLNEFLENFSSFMDSFQSASYSAQFSFDEETLVERYQAIPPIFENYYNFLQEQKNNLEPLTSDENMKQKILSFINLQEDFLKVLSSPAPTIDEIRAIQPKLEEYGSKLLTDEFKNITNDISYFYDDDLF